MAKTKILLVEDDKDTCVVTRALVRSFGYDVVVASDGITAVTMARSEQPQLILLDIGLPGQSGYKVLKTLKGAAETVHIPIVVVSAQEPFSSRDLALEYGASDFLQKPVDRETLLAALRAHVGHAGGPELAAVVPACRSERPCVMLVDREDGMLQPVANRLAREPLDVVLVEDAIAAVAAARRQRPDVLVCEMHLAGGDCFDLVERLADVDPSLRALPLLLVTARNYTSTLSELARGYHIVGSYAQPFDPEQLARGVLETLGVGATPAR